MKPVPVRSAIQQIFLPVILNRGAIQKKRSIDAADKAAGEMADARREVSVTPPPFGHQGDQRSQIRVVDGRAADEDVLTGAAAKMFRAARAI